MNYTKKDLEKLLVDIKFSALVKKGDIVTNREAHVLRDKIIKKDKDLVYNFQTHQIEVREFFICEKSGKWYGTTPGWVLEANPLPKLPK